MSHPVGYPLRDRIEVEFVEADVEMGFQLVDMAKAESALAANALENAEAVFSDIERRLARMDSNVRTPFTALVEELRREIDQARQHSAG